MVKISRSPSRLSRQYDTQNPPTDRDFQTAMAVMIAEVYVDSVSGVLYPLHGCWLDSLHLYNIQNILSCAFQYVFCFADLHIYSDTKKNCQGDSHIDWSSLDLHQVYHDIQNTEGSWWWNRQPYFVHANFHSFTVCVLPWWNLVIHTMSPNLVILDLTKGLSIQYLE